MGPKGTNGGRRPAGGKGSNQYATKGAPVEHDTGRADRAAVNAALTSDAPGDVPEPLPELLLQPANYTISHYLIREPADHVNVRDNFDLDAPYQRDSVWDDERRRNLVKSLIMGLPVGQVTVAKLPYDRDKVFRIVDGKQRIETVRKFVNDEFTIPGHWLNDRDLADPADRAGDIVFSQLSKGGQFRFETRSLPSTEYDSQTEVTMGADGNWNRRHRSEGEMLRAEAELYELINFGGVPQTDETRANAAAVAADPEAYLAHRG